ncbi:MAG TPA: beta-propeller fold lactonase family protein, partial [Polyangiaceae bacterium]
MRALALVCLAMIGCSSGDDSNGASTDAGSSPGNDSSVGSSDSGTTNPNDGGAGVDASTPKGPVVVYASGYGTDITVYAADTAATTLTKKSSVAAGDTSPSFLAMRPGDANLYAVSEASPTGRVGAYSVDATSGALTYLSGVSSQGNGPAFLSVDPSGKYVLVANYGDGGIAVLPIQSDGKLGTPTDTRNAGKNAHMMIADASDKYVFVPCLGSDYVAQYTFDASTGTLSPNTPPTFSMPAKSGPRHLALHPNGKWAYLVSETSSSITSLTISATGTLGNAVTQTTVPGTFKGKNTDAEVVVHPSGKWVYASNRGDDSIAIFAVDATNGTLTPTGTTKTGGKTPRSFAVDP